MSGFVGAVTFLTRMPWKARVDEPASLARAVPWFPLVGALVGAAIGTVYAASQTVLPSFLAATIAVAAGTLVTGAFHEDGLADVADAFAGGYTIEHRLEILKDPRHGTFGVMAIGLALLLRIGAIASLDAWAALASLPAAHALSRAAAISLMRRPTATTGGLGVGYGAHLSGSAAAVAIVVGVVLAGALIGLWVGMAIGLSMIVATLMERLAREKVGGITGDVLGATQQVVELGVLLIMAMVVHEGWEVVPWWRR